MNGIMRVTAIAMLGASLLGGELAAGANLAQGAKRWIAGGEGLALRRAGSIAAGTLVQAASERARALAFDATIRVVRGVGAVYGAMQGPVRCEASSCSVSVHTRVHAHAARPSTS